MHARRLRQYYRKVLIPAVAMLMGFSANIACADELGNVQPESEVSKNSDPSAANGANADSATVASGGYRRVQLRLTGSMCMACLKDLEDNLLKIKGVERVKVEKPTAEYYAAVSPDVSPWSQTTILYNPRAVNLAELRQAIKHRGYQSFHVVDKELEHAPTDKDTKL